MDAILSVRKLRRSFVGLDKHSPWGGFRTPIKSWEVMECIKEGKLRKDHWYSFDWGIPVRQYHMQRIAYLVVHGWRGKIQINCREGDLSISDGNHRYAAALIRKDESIKASLWCDSPHPKKTMWEFIEKYGY